MNKKKVLLTVCALVLLLAITVTGTLAYLSTSTKEVKNTFVVAGGGKIIDPTTNAPLDNLEDGFFLVETEYTYDEATAAYVKGTDTVLANTYDKVAPSMTIGKDPKLTANIATGASAYVFVEVVDTTVVTVDEDTKVENVDWSIATGWTELTGVTGANGGTVYVWNNGSPITGADGADLAAVSVLNGDSITIAGTVQDADANTDGTQLGDLSFYAYACQAQSFTSAADAYDKCF